MLFELLEELFEVLDELVTVPLELEVFDLRDVDFVPELLSEDLFEELELDELHELVTVALEL